MASIDEEAEWEAEWEAMGAGAAGAAFARAAAGTERALAEAVAANERLMAEAAQAQAQAQAPDTEWEAKRDEMVAHHARHGRLLAWYESTVWVRTQRAEGAAGTMSLQRRALLEELPFWKWKPEFDVYLNDIAKYHEDYGCMPPKGSDGGKWLTKQQRHHAGVTRYLVTGWDVRGEQEEGGGVRRSGRGGHHGAGSQPWDDPSGAVPPPSGAVPPPSECAAAAS